MCFQEKKMDETESNQSLESNPKSFQKYLQFPSSKPKDVDLKNLSMEKQPDEILMIKDLLWSQPYSFQVTFFRKTFFFVLSLNPHIHTHIYVHTYLKIFLILHACICILLKYFIQWSITDNILNYNSVNVHKWNAYLWR